MLPGRPGLVRRPHRWRDHCRDVGSGRDRAGVTDAGEGFDTVDQPRPGAGKRGVGVHRPDRHPLKQVIRRTCICSQAGGGVESVAARRDNDDVRIATRDVLPCGLLGAVA